MGTHSTRPLTPLSLALVLAVASAGCTQALNMGLGMAGHTSGLNGSAGAPAAVTSTYEHTPASAWQRFAVGYPFSPRFNGGGDQPPTASCAPAAQGITRVLPVSEGSPSMEVQRVGPVSIGAAGVPIVNAEQLFRWRQEGMVESMMQRTARLSSFNEGCQTNVFAFVRLGPAGSDDPVSVLR